MTTSEPNAQPKHTNRLIDESSPYLLQHAHNPVDWYPWCDEAFEEAKRRGVAVFLSIGYSTCYWCHVMERECFEDETIAQQMNERFVCVKLDREQRPDLDDLYMAATQIFTGSGGWPMSVFLDPETRKPFWCGTYFPPTPMHGRPSFPQILEGLSEAFKDKRDEIREQSEAIANAVREQLTLDTKSVALGVPQITRTTTALLTQSDRTNGGFGGAPKFPQPVYLQYLLDVRAITDAQTQEAIDAVVRRALDAMAIGGINDHAGGGFHRYAVDAHWTVPHFEKMLYDNAQLAELYARASAQYQDSFYAHTARRTIDYVLREMTDASDPGASGFFSAQDAEIDGREGLNYLWTDEEFDELLAEDSELAKRVYGLDTGPNFQDPHHPDDRRRSVLRLEERPDRIAPALGRENDELMMRLATINTRLLAARNKREQPGLDDKVLCAWNGMMISALAIAGRTLNESRYIEAAQRAARFVLTNMRTDENELARAYRAGSASIPALLEDYAMLVRGLLELHKSGEHGALDDAIELMEEAERLFSDPNGGYHDTRADQSDLFLRARSTYDGAVPSGSSVMLSNLVSLARITSEDRWIDRAVSALSVVSSAINANGVGVVNSTRQLIALMTMRPLVGERYSFVMEMDESDSSTAASSPVAVFVSESDLSVRDDSPASFEIAFEIDDGYHIVAADPGDSDAASGLVPLRVGLISGQGVAVYADYPDGEESGAADIGAIRVHSGRVEFTVAVEKAPGVGPTPGEPILGVSFQACTDNACRKPQTFELKIRVAID
jgi:hypothetical protein